MIRKIILTKFFTLPLCTDSRVHAHRRIHVLSMLSVFQERGWPVSDDKVARALSKQVPSFAISVATAKSLYFSHLPARRSGEQV